MDPEIKKEFQDIKTGFQGLQNEIREVKEGLQNEIRDVKKGLQNEIKDVKVGFQGMKKDIDDLTEIMRTSFGSVEERMATKEDLKELKIDMGKMKLDLIDAMAYKSAELRGDIIVLMRKEDTKVVSLVELLKRKTVITDSEAKAILTMTPFPQLFV